MLSKNLIGLLLVAGAAGTLARYVLTSWLQQRAGTAFPWGTFAVNAIGCFLFGLGAALAEERGVLTPATRTVLLSGFLGAFTTYSTFAHDTAGLLARSQWALAAANLLGQNAVGIALVFLGAAIVRAR